MNLNPNAFANVVQINLTKNELLRLITQGFSLYCSPNLDVYWSVHPQTSDDVRLARAIDLLADNQRFLVDGRYHRFRFSLNQLFNRN